MDDQKSVVIMKCKSWYFNTLSLLKKEIVRTTHHFIQHRLYWALLITGALFFIGLIAICDYGQYFPNVSSLNRNHLFLKDVNDQIRMFGWAMLFMYLFYRFGRQLYEKGSGVLLHIALVVLIIPVFQHGWTLYGRYWRVPFYDDIVEVAGFCMLLILPCLVRQLVQIINPLKQWKNSLRLVFTFLLVNYLILHQVHFPMLILWNLLFIILVLGFWRTRIYWRAGLLLFTYIVMLVLTANWPDINNAFSFYARLFPKENHNRYVRVKTQSYDKFIEDRLRAFRFVDTPVPEYYHPLFDSYTEMSLHEIKDSGFFGRGVGTFTEINGYNANPEQAQVYIMPKYLLMVTFKEFGVPGFILVITLYTLLFMFLIRHRTTTYPEQLLQWSLILFLTLQIAIQVARTLNLAPLLPSFALPFMGFGYKALFPAYMAMGWIWGLYSKDKDVANEQAV